MATLTKSRQTPTLDVYPPGPFCLPSRSPFFGFPPVTPSPSATSRGASTFKSVLDFSTPESGSFTLSVPRRFAPESKPTFVLDPSFVKGQTGFRQSAKLKKLRALCQRARFLGCLLLDIAYTVASGLGFTCGSRPVAGSPLLITWQVHGPAELCAQPRHHLRGRVVKGRRGGLPPGPGRPGLDAPGYRREPIPPQHPVLRPPWQRPQALARRRGEEGPPPLHDGQHKEQFSRWVFFFS